MIKARIPYRVHGHNEEYSASCREGIQQSLRDRIAHHVRRMIRYGIRDGAALEVGCGAGHYGLEWLASTGDETSLVGVDMNTAVVARAEKNRAARGFTDERADYYTINESQLPFEDNSFDAVFSWQSLHLWTDPAAMLEELYRVLKPGGCYYLVDTRRDAGAFVRFHSLVLIPRHLHQEYIAALDTSYSSVELDDLLRKTSVRGGCTVVSRSMLTVSGMKPTILKLKRALRVAGVAAREPAPEGGSERRRLLALYRTSRVAELLAEKKRSGRLFLIRWNRDPIEKVSLGMAAHEVKQRAVIPGNLHVHIIPSGDYAVFTVRPATAHEWHAAVDAMRDYVYTCWIPRNGYMQSLKINDFEMYEEPDLPNQPGQLGLLGEEGEIYLYVSIKKCA